MNEMGKNKPVGYWCMRRDCCEQFNCIHTGFKPTEPTNGPIFVIGEFTNNDLIIRGLNHREKEIVKDVVQKLNNLKV